MAVRLSALRAGLPSPARRFLLLISVWGWVDPSAIVRLERLRQMNVNNNWAWSTTHWFACTCTCTALTHQFTRYSFHVTPYATLVLKPVLITHFPTNKAASLLNIWWLLLILSQTFIFCNQRFRFGFNFRKNQLRKPIQNIPCVVSQLAHNLKPVSTRM
jgi:hypothetical protein